MERYRCGICGYVYEPAVGDRMRKVAPGTNWDDLPGGWVCPICGASRDDFSLIAPDKALPQPGVYRHYKGNNYRLLGIAKHSETLEDMAVYRALYGDRGLWVRPLSMWSEEVMHEGRRQPRFQAMPDNGDGKE